MLDALTWGSAIAALVSGVASATTDGVCSRLASLVRDRFGDDHEATTSLEQARYHPHDAAALRGLDRQLDRHACEDPEFGRRLLDLTVALEQSNTATHQTLGHAHVDGHAIQLGRDNVGGINLGWGPQANRDR